MKILHLSNIAGKLGGGVSQVVHSLLYHQTSNGAEARLWFLGHKRLEKEISSDEGLDIDRLSAIKLRSFLFPSIFIRFNSLLNEVNIVHQHGIFLPTSLLSLMASRSNKVIISPHGYLEPEKLRVSILKKKIVLFLFEKLNLMNCSCLIACSRQEASYLRDFGLKQPIALLPNGVDESFVRNDSNNNKNTSFRTKYEISLDTKVLLFLSRIHPFKGLKLFLESLVIIKEQFRKNKWIFIIAGQDELNHEKELRQIVTKHKMEDIVRFVGPQYGKEKIEALDSADCFILPSKGENFGISIIEALARGVPVLTTKNTPWKELNETQCGWWIERSIEGFSNTLLQIISTSSSDLCQMGNKGIVLIKDRFTWPNITIQSMQIYKWVLNDFREEYNNGFSLYEEEKKEEA